jgi:hypothetical protein
VKRSSRSWHDAPRRNHFARNFLSPGATSPGTIFALTHQVDAGHRKGSESRKIVQSRTKDRLNRKRIDAFRVNHFSRIFPQPLSFCLQPFLLFLPHDFQKTYPQFSSLAAATTCNKIEYRIFKQISFFVSFLRELSKLANWPTLKRTPFLRPQLKLGQLIFLCPVLSLCYSFST